MRLDRLLDPRFAKQTIALPFSVVEVKLRDLKKIAVGQLYPPASLRNAQRRVNPLHVRDAERSKQFLLRVTIRSHPRGFLQDLAQGKYSAGAVAEITPVRRR